MCPEKSTLSAYYDGELSETSQKEVLLHINFCTDCQEDLKHFETQHRLLQQGNCLLPPIKESLNGFWRYAHQIHFIRNRFIGGRGQFVISIPLVAIFLGFLLISMFLNIFPLLKESKTPVVVLEPHHQPSTVISITVPPGELDNILALIEGTQGFNGEATHILPIHLPVAQVGNPRIIRVANTGKAP